jgi:hypothetical protein
MRKLFPELPLPRLCTEKAEAGSVVDEDTIRFPIDAGSGDICLRV